MRLRAPLMATLALTTLVGGTAFVVVPGADAVETTSQGALPSAKPVPWTPDVLGANGARGKVVSLAEVGNLIVVGGTFNQIVDNVRGITLNRTNVAAFDATTGQVSDTFAPVLNAPVQKVLAAPDGTSVFVGGGFTTLNGAASSHLLKLNVATGAPVSGFAGVVKGTVQSMDLAGNRLFLGGQFSTINGKAAFRLGEIDATTGKTTIIDTPVIAGTHHGVGATGVSTVDASADGQHLLISGNFGTVNGVVHSQVAEFTITPTGITLDPWHSPLFDQNSCNQHYQHWVEDAQFAPDSSYFVVDGTGAYGNGTAGLCDSASRWNFDPTNTNASPAWVEYAGGDSFTSVQITDTAIYVGGHYRWQNNPFCGDCAGQGAINFRGLAALDPSNGLPLNWNPGGILKLGYYDFLPTDKGIFTGSDFLVTGNGTHKGIAFFPLATGHTPPASTVATLPVNVIRLGQSGDSAATGTYDGATFGAVTTLPSSGIAWSNARGAFDINGNVYAAMNNGTLTKETFNGTSFGSATTVNLNGLTNFATEMQQMTSMFYLNGHIYYTVNGSSQLRSRGFSADADVVGALSFVTANNLPDINWANVSGMFYANGNLYWVNRVTGDLMRSTWANGGPVAGTAVVVSGPGKDANTWTAKALVTTNAH